MSSGRKLYILCGGQSRRMGMDKALIKFKGESLLNHQIKKASPYFDEVVLLNGRNTYTVDVRQLKDDFEDVGPLAGLLEALKDGAEDTLSQIAVIPVDLPGLSRSTIEKLYFSIPDESEDAILLQSGENLQPLAGVYKTELADKLQHFLETGKRMVFGFVDRLDFSVIDVDAKELKNVNRPGDLKNNS